MPFVNVSLNSNEANKAFSASDLTYTSVGPPIPSGQQRDMERGPEGKPEQRVQGGAEEATESLLDDANVSRPFFQSIYQLGTICALDARSTTFTVQGRTILFDIHTCTFPTARECCITRPQG